VAGAKRPGAARRATDFEAADHPRESVSSLKSDFLTGAPCAPLRFAGCGLPQLAGKLRAAHDKIEGRSIPE